MLILVDDRDMPIGQMEKMEAHEKALLHRAFSVFIFNSEGQLLLQQRALGKYHTPGLWTNSCCSHPMPGETTEDAALRRLNEELGLKTDIRFVNKFKYKYAFDNDLTEHEIDHVFVGYTDAKPLINENEVNDYKYVSLDEIEKDIKNNPLDYTPWFKIILENNCNELKKHAKKQINL